MPKKKKTLPDNFEERLENDSLEQLIKIFDTCEIDAVGGYEKQTALAFEECPHELASWLLAQGLDIETPDKYGYTPLQSRSGSYRGNIKSLLDLGADANPSNQHGTALHCAARNFNSENVKTLIKHGANIEATTSFGYDADKAACTPLEIALFSCQNSDIVETAEVCKILLHAGAKKTDRAAAAVTKIGQQFEFHKSNFNKDDVEETTAALNELYQLFGVAPVSERKVHDGKSPITVTADTWQKQHGELWRLLVPSGGAAQTMQGEVIRITGRMTRELKDNGGANWDNDFKKMAESLVEFIQQGNSLSPEAIAEMKNIIAEVKSKNDKNTYRMTELGVNWVVNNPTPIATPVLSYKR